MAGYTGNGWRNGGENRESGYRQLAAGVSAAVASKAENG